MNTQSHAPRPVLFLIDGHSQMYRAYHAIRGLTGPDGRSTNAVYGFVTMLRKLVADQRPELIACAFDLAGPTFRSALAADYKANRPAMPDDLVEQIPFVHRACEALGVPILSCEGFEADDVIGTVAERATRDGLPRRRSSPATRTCSSSSATACACSTRATRAPGTTPRACARSSASRRTQVVDVLALMGDSVDNIKGVPGHRRQGRARADRRRSARSTRCSERAGEVAAEEIPRGAARRRRPRAPEPRAGAHPPRRADRVRHRGVPLPRAEPAGVLRAVRRARVPIAASASSRRRPRHVARDYATRRDARGGRGALRRGAARGRPVRAPRRSPTSAARRCGPTSSGSRSRPATGTARYVPLGAPRARRGPAARPPRRARGAEGRARGSGRREGRPRPQARRDGARALRRRRCAASRSTRCSPATCSTRRGRRTRSRRSRSSTWATRRSTEEDVCGRGAKALELADLPPAAVLDFAGERVDLAWQLAGASRAGAGRRTPGRVSTATSSCRSIPVLADIERAGVKVDTGVLGRLSERLERELAGAQREDLRAGRRVVQHQLAEAAVGGAVRQAEAAGRQADRARRGVGSTAVDVLEELALVARTAAPDPRVAKRPEAEGHLHRRAAAARESGDRARAHVASTRPSPRPGG